MKVALVCASGMSTSLLVNSMRKFAGKEDQIEAFSVEAAETYAVEYDVILVGPQLRFRYQEIEKDLAEYHKPIRLLDARLFGKMDGKAALELAREALIQSGEGLE